MKTNKSTVKKLLCIAVALVCVFSSVFVFPQVAAKTVEELNQEIADIEKDIQENQEKLDEVEQDIKTNEDKLKDLNGQIDKINTQIDLLDESINILNGDINAIEGDIEVTENDIQTINVRRQEIALQVAQTEALMGETEDLLLARIRENYMSGGSGSTIELLLSSDDMSTFFARKELVTRVSEEDAKLIADLSGSIVELNSLNNELEAKKTELEEKEEKLNTQMTALSEKQENLEANKEVQEDKKSDVTGKQNEVKYLLEDLDKDSEAYKQAIARKEKERAALEAQIEAAIKDNGSNEGDTPDEEYNNDGEMLWPVAGKTTVTAGYPNYKDGSPHGGIDICIVGASGGTRDENGKSYSLGKPFRAAQGGKVILAKNDGNWNYGFGNYCIIDHGDGKHTLYAHAQTLYVSEGDVVQKGEKIGLIGDTGNTTGPHLHFEVRIKDSSGNVNRVNPLNYVSKP